MLDAFKRSKGRPMKLSSIFNAKVIASFLGGAVLGAGLTAIYTTLPMNWPPFNDAVLMTAVNVISCAIAAREWRDMQPSIRAATIGLIGASVAKSVQAGVYAPLIHALV
jgi:hypothetical protein